MVENPTGMNYHKFLPSITQRVNYCASVHCDGVRKTMTETYTDEELIEMLQQCTDRHGVCSPRVFNADDDFCSASTVMRRFGSWEDGKKEAGVYEDLKSQTGRNKEYTDGDVLKDIRKCAERHDGKVTVTLLSQEEDLVSPSVANDRFGSWSEAKKEAGVEEDGRKDNHRPRKYSDDEYFQLLKECQEKHGKVTQRVFNADDEFPSAGAVSQRFGANGSGGWDKAKQMAGLEKDTETYSDEELLDQLRECKERYGNCSASKFAADDDFASPETVQRRFEPTDESQGGWERGKELAFEQARKA